MKNGIKVSTVEHALAALYAAGIDNCLIQVSGPEFPILDGSAKAYVENIQRVGIEEQNAVKDYYIIKSKIEFRDEETGSSIIVLPDENFSVNALISYQSKILSNQFATLEDMAKFPTEVASARTFVFVREIEPLLGAGLIKGGDLDNAIVIYEKEMSQENYDKLADIMGGSPHGRHQTGLHQPCSLGMGQRTGPPQTAGYHRRPGTDRQTHQGTYHRHPSGAHHQQQVCPPDTQRNQTSRNTGSVL